MDEALLAAAPPPPIAVPRPRAASPERTATPPSVAALLHDALDVARGRPPWSADAPLSSEVEVATARLGKPPRLPSLAYLEAEDAAPR